MKKRVIVGKRECEGCGGRQAEEVILGWVPEGVTPGNVDWLVRTTSPGCVQGRCFESGVIVPMLKLVSGVEQREGKKD